jgi:hypothetical protein
MEGAFWRSLDEIKQSAFHSLFQSFPDGKLVRSSLLGLPTANDFLHAPGLHRHRKNFGQSLSSASTTAA